MEWPPQVFMTPGSYQKSRSLEERNAFHQLEGLVLDHGAGRFEDLLDPGIFRQRLPFPLVVGQVFEFPDLGELASRADEAFSTATRSASALAKRDL